jgi:hypothetical protein
MSPKSNRAIPESPTDRSAKDKLVASLAAAHKTLRIPITNTCDGSDYSAQILVGRHRVPANVLLDTGSSSLAIDPRLYNPGADKDARPTRLAQRVAYADYSGWLGPVVKTSVTIGNAADNITLANAPVAVTDFQTRGNFDGGIDGIMGLAYLALNDAYEFPQSTWPWPFPHGSYKNALQKFLHLIKSKKIPSVNIDPYFSELAGHRLTMNKFAFYTLRSWVHKATHNRSAIERDPLNRGVFVLGGGEKETDLYSGSFVHVDVLHDVYYNTHLISVQVGGLAAVKAKGLQHIFQSEDYSNSIIDSGTNSIDLAHDVFRAVMESLEHLNPKFGSLVRLSSSSNSGIPASHLDLAEWPDIHFFFKGANGKPVRLTCATSTYWQVNYPAPGRAVFQIDQGSTAAQANESTFGLPLFNNYYTVFDRSQGKGNGVISFAPIVQP